MTAGLMVTILVFPVALGLSMGEHVASLLFGQDAQTSALMGQFCRGLIPGMWPLMWGIVLTKYLQVRTKGLLPRCFSPCSPRGCQISLGVRPGMA